MHGWIVYLGIFTVVALVSCVTSSKATYIGQLIALDIRERLTNKALDLVEHHQIEGINQRIQEDCKYYPQLLLSILTGVFRATILIAIFTYIIVHQLNVWYLLIPLGYAAIGTLIAGKIAMPLIELNYTIQVLEAKFRQVLSLFNYSETVLTNKQLFKKEKHLSYFQSFYNQITIIFPHLVLANLYFASKISFGVFMQIASAMVEMTNHLSYIINSFSSINKFLSCRRRLKELKVL